MDPRTQIQREAEPSEEKLAQPSLGASRPAEVGQVGNHHHLSFTCLCRTWLQEVREVESAWGKPGAWGPTKAWLRFFSVSRVAPWRPGSDPLIPTSWKRAQPQCWICIFKRLGDLLLLLRQSEELWPTPSRATSSSGVEREALRGRVGGPQMHIDQAGDAASIWVEKLYRIWKLTAGRQ